MVIMCTRKFWCATVGEELHFCILHEKVENYRNLFAIAVVRWPWGVIVGHIPSLAYSIARRLETA